MVYNIRIFFPFLALMEKDSNMDNQKPDSSIDFYLPPGNPPDQMNSSVILAKVC